MKQELTNTTRKRKKEKLKSRKPDVGKKKNMSIPETENVSWMKISGQMKRMQEKLKWKH